MHNFYIVNWESQGKVTSAVSQAGGVVLLSGELSFSADTDALYTVTVTSYVGEGSYSTYAGSGVEAELLRSGILFQIQGISPCTYVVDLPYPVKDEKAMSDVVAYALNSHGSTATVIF